ncbi:hypothetical protein BHM03_00048311, partial [Ensete ventricosum]
MGVGGGEVRRQRAVLTASPPQIPTRRASSWIRHGGSRYPRGDLLRRKELPIKESSTASDLNRRRKNM